MVAGLIRRALPKARLLHMARDPMDVCFSNFRAMLGARYAYSFDLQMLAEHFRQYRRLMAHWHAAMPGESWMSLTAIWLVTPKPPCEG